MVIRKYARGIALILILNIVLVGAAASAGPAASIAVSANNTAPQVNQTISITAAVKDANGSISTSLDGGTMLFLADNIQFAQSIIANGAAETTFTGTTAGAVTITAFFNATLKNSIPVSFAAPPEPSLIVFAIPTTITAGTPTSVSFTVASGSAAVGGATVILTGAATGNGTTDPNGNAVIIVNATGAGTVTATVSKAGFASASTTITAIVPALSMTATPATVASGTPTNVTFTVSSDGVAVSDATVTLTGAATGSGITDASGNVVISVNATGAGAITATASKSGFDTGSKTISAIVPSLSLATNPTNVTVAVSTNVTFTVSSDSIAVSDATVTLTGAATGNGITDASGIVVISVNATGAGAITATATKPGFSSGSTIMFAAKAPDTTPPENIANLTVSNKGQTYINWSWTNPSDEDLSGLRILIDDVFAVELSKESNYYNATGFPPDTNHSITVIAFDNAGNNATSPPLSSATTLPNTFAGENVEPSGLPSNINIRFSNVTKEGNTTVSFESVAPALHAFQRLGSYADIATTATIEGEIEITLNYPQPPAGFNESNVRMYHLNNTVWEDVTTGLDAANNKVTGVVEAFSFFAVGIFPPPQITVIEPVHRAINITIGESLFFKISINQIANITWKIDNSTAGSGSNFTFKPAEAKKYRISVEANNINGTDQEQWNVTVVPKTYFTGDRIWDERKHSSTYAWNPYSFSGFYYNLDDDLGAEELTIKNIRSTIARGDITYRTSPQVVGFEYSPFGSYEVIGFMADKYFAGYTANSTVSNNKVKSALGGKQLHRVLLDDEDRRTISEGGTLTLKEGYVLKMTAVDIGAGPGQIWVTLLKDGNEVDTDVVAGDETYVYQPKKVGSVSDLPIIAVHFERVFRGREVNAAFIKGIFQISETFTSVKTGDRYGEMEIKSVGASGIEMRNENSIDISSGSKIDLMGDLKIIVADNSSVLRIALSVERTGTFEVRGTVYPATDEWTPMNFGMNIGGTSIGFYYDMDEDVGNERLRIEGNVSGSIPEDKLKYSTSPAEVSFDYSPFGSYEVIGFMADKYFAGYTANSIISNNKVKSALGGKQLHKVLLDDEDRRTISEGGTLTLKEGYVLKMTAVDIGAGPGQIWVTLLKDGNEVDTDVVAGDETYVYQPKKVGSVSDLPTIAVHFERVFRGREVNAAFIKGIFQISEAFTSVKTGDRYGEMEIKSVGAGGIEMKNENSIDLSSGSTVDLMGNIKFKVADSSDVRFYPFVEVKAEMLANQLVIDAPAKANAGDAINIKVTAGGSTVEGAAITLQSEIGSTNTAGILNYTLPKTLKGIYNITATKLGYQKAIKSIEVLEYIEYRLSIDAPAKANQFENITIRVTSNGTAINGATLKFNDIIIGQTDNKGMLNYTLQTSGTHTISASKSGYITAARDIEVKPPFSEYRALDINITPGAVYTNEEVLIRSNITNAGTKADTLPVELVVNGTVVDNRSVALAPNDVKEINFTHKEALSGNYTVEILGQKGLLEVREEPLNLLFIVGIATGFGAVIIYLLTSKSKVSLEAVRRLLGKFGKKGVEKVTPPGEGKV